MPEPNYNRVISIDTGYSRTKVYQEEGEQPASTVFSSTFGDFAPTDDFLGQATDDFVFEVDGKAYNFGDTAIESNAGSIFTIDKNQFVTEHNPLLTWAAIGRHVAKYPQAVPETLVLSLPIAFYREQKPVMEKIFAQKKVIRLLTSNGEVKSSYQLNFRKIHILPQGYEAYLSLFIDPRGNKNQSLAKGNITIIDSGGKTIDVMRIQNGKMLPQSTSIPTGLDEIYRQIQDDCYARFDECPERPRIEYQIHAGEPYLMKDGTEVDFANLRQQVIDQTSDHFLTRLRQAVGQSAVGKILVCGGSGKIYFNHIKRAYPTAEELPLGTFANAIGGFRYGKYLSS